MKEKEDGERKKKKEKENEKREREENELLSSKNRISLNNRHRKTINEITIIRKVYWFPRDVKKKCLDVFSSY